MITNLTHENPAEKDFLGIKTTVYAILRYADKGVGDHNYCRNPAEKYIDLWCYTDSTETRWDWCDVPTCGNMIL